MKRSLALILLLLVTGCGLLPEVQDETKGWSAQKLYSEAKNEMNDGNYSKAIKYFETLEARYPYGRYAQQSQLEEAYAYFKDNEPVSAIAACDRFIKLHPNHPNVDYAYYLKGLANFNEDLGLLGAIADQDLSERDPKAAKDSFEAFRELVTRFPKSKYAPDAAARMKYLVNTLAASDVHIARYYARRGAYVAAVNRAQIVLQEYPQTPATEEALAIMVQSYDAMGLNDLRDDTRRVLSKNYPNSKFLNGSSQSKKPWWRLW
ncbi:outer membrane protein assembly factor BamD [Sulfurimicrobium lacus]|uniref:Outer membrane protein assembly factor BamD n=1 Tax=Sulfurimicrobium lacus TaxID=2715678 RepID=A0A6F8VDJ9_9PROT|nr:outer membrane protein assembly factor BamD [Sulfurimicrobium lacus]BCB27754.1 outer membrane protein assembly factor BamD [Sulfurimicrobium lacus]